MRSRDRSRSNSGNSLNGTSPMSSVISSTNNGTGKTQNKKRKSTDSTESNGSSKRKSSRLAQLEVNTTPKLSASPNIKETGLVDVISDSDASSISLGQETKFTEPELAPPTPSYTGLPLEEFPSAKIKKESLWPQKLKRAKGKDSDSSREVSQTPETDGIKEQKLEARYRSQLKTPVTRDITNESEIRTPPSAIPRATRPARLKLTVKTPKQPITNRKTSKSTPKNALKKLKFSSPKKSPSTKLLAPDTKVKHETHHEEDTHKDNDDFCFACGRPGIFICCETCPKSFHFTCCDPPIEEPPEDDWYCHECFAKRYPQLIPNWKDVGIFGKLLNDLEVRNPKVFQLPRNFRDDTFIGVYTGENGDYADDSEKPDMPASKRNGSQIPGFNRNEDLEVEKLYDEKGNPFLCHKCGESGQNHRTLIKCDYCPLIYHVDCLPYPMFGPKTIGDKWRCPNHIRDLLPKGFPEMRQFKETEVVEGSLHSNFLNILAMDSFVVKFDTDEYFKDNSKHTLDEFEIYPDELGKLNALSSWGSDMEAIHPNYKIPAYFKTESTSDGVLAKMTNKVVGIPKSTSSNLTTYRIPERSILLDFAQKVQGKKDILTQNEEYDYVQRLEESSPAELEVVDGLKLIKERQKQLNLDALLKIVNLEEDHTTESPKLKAEEIDELVKIKKLMEAKGQDALLSFLKAN